MPDILSWTSWLGHPSSGWFVQTSDFSAGVGDTVSLGLTQRIREGWGYDDVVNKNSLAYLSGQIVGAGINLALSFANPCGAGGTALRLFNGLQAFGGAVNYVDNMMQGNYLTAALDAVGVLGNLSQLSRACFSGDTMLMARGPWGCGWRRIDAITTEDEVLSRWEDDPNGPLEWKKVEELFKRNGFMAHLHIGGEVIRTTMEHPFYVLDKGWVPASEVQPGDLLSSHDRQWVPVEQVLDTGDYETVYNLRVADFSIQNAEPTLSEKRLEQVERKFAIKLPIQYRKFLLAHNGGQPVPNQFHFKKEQGPYTDSMVDWFLAVYEGENDNFEEYFDTYKGDEQRLPENLVPIAHDPGGNLVCISVSGDDEGAVFFFWDHEHEEVETTFT